MAVQAQYQALSDQRNRATQLPGFDLSTIDPRSLLSPIPYQGAMFGECPPQQHAVLMQGGSAMKSMQVLPQHVASSMPIPGFVLPNFAVYQQAASNTPMPDMDTTVGSSRKRRKESLEHRSAHFHQQHMHNHQPHLGVDLNQALGCSPASTLPPSGVHNVSTGLRLAFDDERSTVTSSRLDSNTSASLIIKDELSAQLSQHQEEINQLISAQAEQLRQALEERSRRQSEAFLTALEGGLSKRLLEKEAEMERISRHNMELEETVKQLSMESQVWQSKAKNNEAMVAILRTNLQQAVLLQHQSREQQSRLEGCGDSEVDDAISVYIDDNPHAQQSRANIAGMTRVTQYSHYHGVMKRGANASNNTQNIEAGLTRACRRCKVKEASAVLLPCLHLCLCVACKDECERCPVCSTSKSASVEVYLS